jgi:hypothetical protein
LTVESQERFVMGGFIGFSVFMGVFVVLLGWHAIDRQASAPATPPEHCRATCAPRPMRIVSYDISGDVYTTVCECEARKP